VVLVGLVALVGVVAALHLVCRRFLHGPSLVGVELVVLGGLGAVLTYAVGVFSAFTWLEDECRGRPVDYRSDEAFPLRIVCIETNGQAYEQVDPLVHPILLACLGVLVAGLVVFLVAAGRDAFAAYRRASTAGRASRSGGG
jgi:hypothetical protein